MRSIIFSNYVAKDVRRKSTETVGTLESVDGREEVRCEGVNLRVTAQIGKNSHQIMGIHWLTNMPEIFEAGFKTVATVLYELWPSMMGPRKSR